MSFVFLTREERARRELKQLMGLYGAEFQREQERFQEIVQTYPQLAREKWGENGQHPLHQVVRQSQTLSVVRAVFEVYPEAVKEKDKSGRTPLLIACVMPQQEQAIRLFVEKCPEALRGKDNDGLTPLHYACAFKQPEHVIQFLVEKHPGGVKEKSKSGLTPLHLACKKEQMEEVIQLLVMKYPDATKEKTKNGWTPLDIARKENASDSIVALLENCSADASSMSDDWLEFVRDNLQREPNVMDYSPLDELSIRIDEHLADRVQWSIASLLPVPFDKFYPKVILSFATGYRKHYNDYPGKLVAAGVIKGLFDRGIACYSDLMTPGGQNWNGFVLRIYDGEMVHARVLVALMTRAFFRSVWCLEEVNEAIEHKCIILPIRVEALSTNGLDISRDRSSMWPIEVINDWAHREGWLDMGEAGTRQMNELKLARKRVRREIMNISSIPAHGALLSDKSVMDELAKRINDIISHCN